MEDDDILGTISIPDTEVLNRENLHTHFSLSLLGRLLTSKTEQEKLFSVHGCDALVRQLAELLALKNNVILVGEPGSGKTAIVEKLASWIVSRHADLPEELLKRHILECDHTAFQDQCLYVHEFETRFRTVIKKCRAKNVTLFFENIHLASAAGALDSNQERTIATMLTPYLSRKQVTVIGTTSPEGYQTLLRRNPALAANFIKWEIIGTSASETMEILNRLCSEIQARYGIEIKDVAVGEIIHVADRFYPWKVFPGKAFDILQETIAKKRMENRDNPPCSSHTLTANDVWQTIERRSGLAPCIIHRNLPLRREKIVRYFENEVYEQKEAVGYLADAILTFKAELNDPQKPIAAFLFAGPTGVGKTELARQLASYLFGSEKRLLRYDMSEFADFDSARRFLGDSRRPTVKGLADAIMAQPFSIVLLDEIEKANPMVFNLLLQALGEGRLTADNGRTAYLANTIFIMTSNLAADLYGKGAKRIGLTGSGQTTSIYRPTHKELAERIKDFFAPEFINRITKIVYFNPLSHEAIKRVAKKEIENVLQRDGILLRGLKVEISSTLQQQIMEKGFNPEYGARPMQRTVQELVVFPLSALLSRSELPPGSEVVLGWDGERVRTSFR